MSTADFGKFISSFIKAYYDLYYSLSSSHYCFNKLPFNITNAPEFSSDAVLDGLQGVLCLIDDILIFCQNKVEHDERLFAELEKIQKVRVTLNAKK